MRIEALEPIRSSGYLLEAGDSITVPDPIGAHWCAQGWANDTAGTVPTLERRVINARVQPHPAAHTQNAKEVK